MKSITARTHAALVINGPTSAPAMLTQLILTNSTFTDITTTIGDHFQTHPDNQTISGNEYNGISTAGLLP
jgi:hypothetical protein